MINNEDGYSNGSRERGLPVYGSRPSVARALSDRLPPSHIEAEQAAIVAIFLDEEGALVEEIMAILSAQDFFRADHQTIFRAVKRLYDAGKPVDLVQLRDELGEDTYNEVGGDIYFHEIMERFRPVSHSGVYHAQVVKQKAIVRTGIEACLETIKEGYSNQFTAEEFVERASRRMQVIESNTAKDDDDDQAAGAEPLRMADAAFRGLAGHIIDCIRPETEACAEAILIQFLVAIGNQFGIGPHFMIGGKAHRCNLYSCLVGPTGCGKGMAWEAVRWILGQASQLFADKPVLTGMTSGEGVIVELKEAAGSVLAVETEFARTLNNMSRDGNSLDAILRQAFEDTTLRIPSKNSPIKVDDAHLSVIAHIPEFELDGKMSAYLVQNGFAGRFLWARAYLFHLKEDGGDFESVRRALGPWIDPLLDAVDFAGKCTKGYKRDAAARDLWKDVYRSLRVRPPGAYGSATSRAAALTMRLAMIYAVLDRCTMVKLTHLESALACWDYCDATAKAIFGAGDGDQQIDKLMSALEAAPDGMTRTRIAREVFRSHIAKDTLTSLLEAARATGHLVYNSDGTNAHKWMHQKYVGAAHLRTLRTPNCNG